MLLNRKGSLKVPACLQPAEAARQQTAPHAALSKRFYKVAFIRKDFYYRQAKEKGFRSRAYFKLKEIDKKHRLLKKGVKVIDIGCAPGGWLQYVLEILGQSGFVVGIDLKETEPFYGFSNISLIKGDFQDEKNRVEIIERLNGKADVILSDIAPDTTGVRFSDAAKSARLVEKVISFALEVLAKDGVLLEKIFTGSEFETVLKELRNRFLQVKIIKPSSSKSESKETYLLCKGLKDQQ